MSQEEKLIDYLYGEMSGAEKEIFEQELQQNPALREELAVLQGSREFLSGLPDVQPPTTLVEFNQRPSKWRRWLLPASIAASFLILFEIFDFQVNTTANGLTFSFGEMEQNAEKEAPNYVTIAEVEQLLERSARAYQRDMLMRDSIWQGRMALQEKNMQKYLNHELTAYQSKQQKDLDNFTAKLREEEFPEIANLVQNLLNEHQQETRVLLGEAWQSWQATRDNDLNSIRSEFVNVYQNQNETDALLLNVINSGDD